MFEKEGADGNQQYGSWHCFWPHEYNGIRPHGSLGGSPPGGINWTASGKFL